MTQPIRHPPSPSPAQLKKDQSGFYIPASPQKRGSNCPGVLWSPAERKERVERAAQSALKRARSQQADQGPPHPDLKPPENPADNRAYLIKLMENEAWKKGQEEKARLTDSKVRSEKNKAESAFMQGAGYQAFLAEKKRRLNKLSPAAVPEDHLPASVPQ